MWRNCKLSFKNCGSNVRAAVVLFSSIRFTAFSLYDLAHFQLLLFYFQNDVGFIRNSCFIIKAANMILLPETVEIFKKTNHVIISKTDDTGFAFDKSFTRASWLHRASNNAEPFYYQLTHIMLKNTELLKHSKITLQHVSVYIETIFRELQSVLG